VIDNNFPKKKLILLAHGSRDNNWCATFEAGLKEINSHLQEDACLAFMEMASPSLEEVVATQYSEGIRHFDILPLFFAVGRHLRSDVPTQIENLQKEYEGLQIHLLDAVGLQDVFWQTLGQMISKEYVEKDSMNQAASGLQG
jgi:sirohydrochlorin cobaltochelatase